MAYFDKTPSNKTNSQQARQKTAPVPPPARNENNSPRMPSSKPQLTSQERQRMIATRAYLRAEQRGFAPGRELEDWLQAEAEVDRLIIKR